MRLRRIAPLAAVVAALAACPVARAAQDFSAAERALFVTNHLARLQPPATLRYTYRKSGTLEEGFDDRIAIELRQQTDGNCCSASAQFLSGPRQLRLPDIEAAEGNPVVLYFLERDIREMQRLTKGQHNYFRKRIRMAVYQAATLRDVTVPLRGRSVAAREITISPYADDPLRARYEALANKQYVFTLCDEVPGGVYSILTRIAGASAQAAPLIVEEVRYEDHTRAIAPRLP